MSEQLNLALSSWRKIGLASFGRRDLISFAITEKNGLSQASSRRNHSSRRIMRRSSWIQGYKVGHRQPLKAQSGSCEVVQQSYVLQFERVCEHRYIYDPRQVF